MVSRLTVSTEASVTLGTMRSEIPASCPYSITVMRGPMDARPTIPKLFMGSLLREAAIPIPRPMAMRIGMVIGPVVTPPESNAMPRMYLGTRRPMMITREYPRVISSFREMSRYILSAARTNITPTPTAMDATSML